MTFTRAITVAIPLVVAGLVAGWAIPAAPPHPEQIPAIVSMHPAASDLASAATAFIGSLRPDQRERATFPFDDAERINWHFIPRARRGLPLGEMSAGQRELAMGILRTALSQSGYLKANNIIELELVLREMGGDPVFRDPELYYFTVFGTPGPRQPWGFRAEGHHLSLNFTVVADSLVATAPSFMGANPAEVRIGSRAGLRVLAAEEDLARELALALDERQRTVAIIANASPRDIVTGAAARVEPLSPIGIRVTELRPPQRELLIRIIDEYLGRMAAPLAERRRAALERTDFGEVAFAWAGSLARGEPHYYRIQGPSFLIEYDNSQNNANHIHSVWRDFEGDFGRDLLRQHYRDAPHGHD